MSDQPRDWDKELAEIDKVIARAPSPSQPPAPAAAGRGKAVESGGKQAAPRVGPLATLTTWLRVILGLLLAIGMTQWPYPTACGLNLAVYLTAIMVVIVAGFWSAISSWRRRLGLAHVLALLVLLWGGILAAREVLPRVGYARHARTWSCDAGDSSS
ncbi:MAG TPA: hypothetical protein VMG41_10935 [Gemmatimonadales bacterium]|nr:hypothetical protein [Gemmatimonadales bacterium]